MSRWVLLGGAGFTGKIITKKLIKNKIPYNKIIMADKEKALKNIKLPIKLEKCDISNNILPKFRKNDIILHLAARQYQNKISNCIIDYMRWYMGYGFYENFTVVYYRVFSRNDN